MRPLEAPRIEEIRAARERIASSVVRTPLVRLQTDDAPAEIYLKLENLQPIGSFKLRGAANAMRLQPKDAIARGVYTASAGNMAQGVAWNARLLGVPCSVVVPAGHGTIGLEILEDLPDVDTILVPYGGGGLSSGIAAAARALKPGVKVFACEVATAAPFAASLAAGSPRSIEHQPSFVDGIGGKSLLAEMWPMVRDLLAGSIVVEVAQAAAAVRLLVERSRVVAEGAGAVPVAAALTGRAGAGKVACVVSGGNIDAEKLAKILSGGIP